MEHRILLNTYLLYAYVETVLKLQRVWISAKAYLILKMLKTFIFLECLEDFDVDFFSFGYLYVLTQTGGPAQPNALPQIAVSLCVLFPCGWRLFSAHFHLRIYWNPRDFNFSQFLHKIFARNFNSMLVQGFLDFLLTLDSMLH